MQWLWTAGLGGRIPVIDLLFGFFAGDAVFLLNLADKLVPVAFDLGQVIVGQLAPLGLRRAFELVPFAFQFIRIHDARSFLLHINPTPKLREPFPFAGKHA